MELVGFVCSTENFLTDKFDTFRLERGTLRAVCHHVFCVTLFPSDTVYRQTDRQTDRQTCNYCSVCCLVLVRSGVQLCAPPLIGAAGSIPTVINSVVMQFCNVSCIILEFRGKW
jgi:hypothetical protein